MSYTGPNRRKKAAKPRRLNERRQDMLILNSATQADIYLWALSLTVMAAVLATFVILALGEMTA